MKKIYLFASSIVLTSAVYAQPVIQSTGLNPAVGESFVTNSSDWVSEGSAGSNVTWDLSALTINQVTPVSIEAPSGSFPNSNVDYNFVGSSQLYYYNNGVKQTVYYQMAGTTLITFSDPMDMVTFPLDMSMNFTDNFTATFTSSGYNFVRQGTNEVVADGYGTLITPEGTFTDVLRVKTTQIYTDTYSLGTIDYEVYYYSWYKNGYHMPLANVYDLNTFQGQTLYASYIETDGLSVDESTQDYLSVYPNPVVDLLTFKNTADLKAYELVDINGKVLINGEINSLDLTTGIDVSGLNSGVYFIKVTNSGNLVKTTKIVKK